MDRSDDHVNLILCRNVITEFRVQIQEDNPSRKAIVRKESDLQLAVWAIITLCLILYIKSGLSKFIQYSDSFLTDESFCVPKAEGVAFSAERS